MRFLHLVRRRPLVFVALALTLAVAGFAVVVPPRGPQWEDMRQWAERRTAAFLAREHWRPVLWGEARDGDGSVHYSRAEQIAGSNRDDYEKLVVLWGSRHGRLAPLPADEEKALLERWAPAIAALHQGARRAAARPRVDVTRGLAAPWGNAMAARWLVNLTVLEARQHLAAGRGLDGVRAFLDAAAYGADSLESPLQADHNIGVAVTATAVIEIEDDHLRRLDDTASAELQRGLERLDQRLPAWPQYEGEVLLLANSLVHDPGFLTASVPWGSTWRHGLSRARVALEAWSALRDLAAAQAEAPSAWPDRQRWHEEQRRALPRSNPLVPAVGPEHTERLFVDLRTRLRLLRVAVALHRGATAPVLEDPFAGRPLEVEVLARGDYLVRSAGRGGDRTPVTDGLERRVRTGR